MFDMKLSEDLKPGFELNDARKGAQKLIAAVDARSLREVKNLLEHDDIDLNWRDSASGNTALHLAVIKELPEIIKVLVMAGADVDITNVVGATPLDIARENGHDYLVDFLQKEKLIKAVFENDVATVNALLCQNIDPNFVEDDDNITPLHFAASNGALSVAQLLITAGANVRATNIEGKTPLDVARMHGHKEMIQFLVRITTED